MNRPEKFPFIAANKLIVLAVRWSVQKLFSTNYPRFPKSCGEEENGENRQMQSILLFKNLILVWELTNLNLSVKMTSFELLYFEFSNNIKLNADWGSNNFTHEINWSCKYVNWQKKRCHFLCFNSMVRCRYNSTLTRLATDMSGKRDGKTPCPNSYMHYQTNTEE